MNQGLYRGEPERTRGKYCERLCEGRFLPLCNPCLGGYRLKQHRDEFRCLDRGAFERHVQSVFCGEAAVFSGARWLRARLIRTIEQEAHAGCCGAHFQSGHGRRDGFG